MSKNWFSWQTAVWKGVRIVAKQRSKKVNPLYRTLGVLDLFCLVYLLPNENTIIYPNFLTWARGQLKMTDFRFCEVQNFLKCCEVSPAKHSWSPKTKGLHRNFKAFLAKISWSPKIKRSSPKFQGFFREKQVFSFWETRIWSNSNPVQHYLFFNTDNWSTL